MIDLNKFGFEKQINAFDSAMSATQITGKSPQLKGSEGNAIDSINKCIIDYDEYCANLNEVFAATSRYLHKALNNIESCEDTNTVN